jgi:hypothetical protein
LQGTAGDCGDSRVGNKSLETRMNTGYNNATGSSSFYLLEMAWSNPTLSASTFKHSHLWAWLPTVATLIPDSSSILSMGLQGRNDDGEPLNSGNCRRQVPLRKGKQEKIYPESAVFCLCYAADGKRRWEILDVTNLNAGLSAKATKEGALLSAVPDVTSSPVKRRNIDDAMATYLCTVAATRAHRLAATSRTDDNALQSLFKR